MRVPIIVVVLLVAIGTARSQQQEELRAVNLESINTSEAEIFPVLWDDGMTLYFTRQTSPKPQKSPQPAIGEIMSSDLQNDASWATPSPVKIFTQVKPAGSISFDTLDNVYIASAYAARAPHDYDIWILNKKSLSRPDGINTALWESQPSVSLDGKDLYFVHNVANNKKTVSICVTHRQQDGSWSKPVDLPRQINFSDYTASPFIADDGKTLFFAADSKNKLQIYISKKGDSDAWTDPVALPEPINGNGHSTSPFLSRDHTRFFFSSDRAGGKGDFDIYEVKLPNGLKSLYDKMTVKW